LIGMSLLSALVAILHRSDAAVRESTLGPLHADWEPDILGPSGCSAAIPAADINGNQVGACNRREP
jgi:hypothetical protein